MKFNPVRQIWQCSIPGCIMVSRPKRAEDDRSVQIGKGAVSTRIIAHDDEVTVLLVSDDNIALDITSLVNVQVLLNSTKAKELAAIAVEDGKDTFVLQSEQQFVMRSEHVVIMGAHDLDSM